MSLSAALQIGRSALTASQLGIQVTGNNIANAATPGYSRQVAGFAPAPGDASPITGSVGRGVLVQGVRRQVDEALLARLWSTAGSGSAAQQQHQILQQLEATLGELGDNSLSSELTAFFSAWSERANQTSANAVIVQQGDKIAAFIHRLRGDLVNQRSQLDGQLGAAVDKANNLLGTIADLNRQISAAEIGGGSANALRDQRDQAITDLSELMDVSVVDHGPQGVDVLVGSAPVLLNGTARPLEVKRVTNNGVTTPVVAVKTDGTTLTISGGQLGGLLTGRTDAVDGAINSLDSIAAQLIFQVNRLHSTGRNLDGLTTTTGSLAFSLADRDLALNDPTNLHAAQLPFAPKNGGFDVVVRQVGTGATRTIRVNVDLDAITAAGTPGFSDDTSAEDIRAALDAVDGIHATFTPEGKLKVEADTGFDFSFANDSSDALAFLGVNSFFTGTDGESLAVRPDLLTNPSQLTAGRVVNGDFIENGTALQIAQLADAKLEALGGQSITGAWRSAADAVGVEVAGARSRAEASSVVRDSLLAQRDAFSGVSIDEEALNLINYQRQYQGAARLISVTDQLTETLMNLL